MADETIDWEPRPPAAEPDADQLFFDAVQKRLDVQIEASHEIDRRVGTAFGVASTVLPVTIGLLNLQSATLDLSARVALVGAIGAYVALISCSYLVARQADFDYRPNVEKLEGLLDDYGGGQIRLWIAKDRAAANKTNQRTLSNKVTYGSWAVRALYVEASLLAIAALFAVLQPIVVGIGAGGPSGGSGFLGGRDGPRFLAIRPRSSHAVAGSSSETAGVVAFPKSSAASSARRPPAIEVVWPGSDDRGNDVSVRFGSSLSLIVNLRFGARSSIRRATSPRTHLKNLGRVMTAWPPYPTS